MYFFMVCQHICRQQDLIGIQRQYRRYHIPYRQQKRDSIKTHERSENTSSRWVQLLQCSLFILICVKTDLHYTTLPTLPLVGELCAWFTHAVQLKSTKVLVLSHISHVAFALPNNLILTTILLLRGECNCYNRPRIIVICVRNRRNEKGETSKFFSFFR
jgi:hypothetical protein